MNNKNLAIVLILTIAISSLTVIFASIPFGKAQSGTTISSTIINSDTTWTKANSPYLLTGPVLVNNGVTLKIEPGASVNFGNYYIQVNGTLQARGTDTNKITLNGVGGLPGYGAIVIMRNAQNWNEQTGLGTIIENANLDFKSIALSITNTSPKINKNYILGSIMVNGYSSWVPNLPEASPVISNNIVSTSGYNLAIQSSGLSSIINNTIKGGITSTGNGKSIISYNTIEGGGYGIQSSNLDYISDNVIYGCGTGIRAGSGTFERNIIRNNGNGILLWINANPIIRNNTITNNVNGISLPGYSEGSRINYHNVQVNYNNIYDNSGYNINLYMDGAYPKNDVEATYNWWGTTDSQAISQKIHDNKNDFNLGKVNFTPFLTEQNPQAMPDSNAPIPTPSSSTIPSSSPASTSTPLASQTPSPSPTVPELSSLAILPLFLCMLFIAVILRHRKTISQNKPNV